MSQLLGSNQFSFGSGYLYGIPLGGTTSQQTPTLLGTLQDCMYDISSSIKELYGQLQFAAAIGRGPAKFTGKAKMGAFNALAWNNFFFGPGLSGGAYPVNTAAAIQTQVGENGSPAANVYQFAPHATATFDLDLGVVYGPGATALKQGLPLQKVPSAPAIGQYSVNTATGTWTFAAGDTDANAANGVKVAYTYQPTTPSRWIQAINNNDFPMGAAPTFEIVHTVPYLTGGTDVTFKIYSAVASKLSIGFKNTDFTIPDIDFTMFANAAGKVIDIITFS